GRGRGWGGGGGGLLDVVEGGGRGGRGGGRHRRGGEPGRERPGDENVQADDGEENDCSAGKERGIVYVGSHVLMGRRCNLSGNTGSTAKPCKVAFFFFARKMWNPDPNAPAAVHPPARLFNSDASRTLTAAPRTDNSAPKL